MSVAPEIGEIEQPLKCKVFLTHCNVIAFTL